MDQGVQGSCVFSPSGAVRVAGSGLHIKSSGTEVVNVSCKVAATDFGLSMC